jgi:hypothetical protein
MSKGVFTRMKRVSFVAKDISEVGNGTAWPLEVTLDQLAEIFHRVKDAHFTGGSITFSSVGVTVHSATTAPAQRSFFDTVGVQGRGYSTPTTAGAATIPARFIPYLTAEYDDGSGDMWRDISDDERGIHLTYQTGELPQWNRISTGISTTAFYYTSTGDPQAPDPLWFYSEATGGAAYYAASGTVLIGGEVAYVLVNPTDSVVASSTRLFLNLNFTVNEAGYNLYASTLETDDPTPVCNYVMRLSSGDVSCPMYPDSYSTGGGAATGTDFIHEATEWWPYAKVGGPVWDTATGAKL